MKEVKNSAYDESAQACNSSSFYIRKKEEFFMSSNWKKYACGALLACLSLAAAGCGSSSSTPETTTVSGKAVKGPIADAMVTAYKMDALGKQGSQAIGSTRTASNGDYTLKIPKSSGPIIIEVRGTETSSYVNEATGTTVRFASDEILRAAVIDPAAVATVSVTPFTDMAVTKLQEYAATAPAGTPLAKLDIAAVNTIENALKTMVGAANFSLSDVNSAGSTAALTLFAQLLTTQSAANPAVNSTSLAQNFVNAITVGGNTLVTLNTQITAAAATLQSSGISTVTPTAIAIAITPDFTDITLPTTPTNLNKSTAFNEVILTWAASSDAAGIAGYFVYRDNIKIAKVTVPGYTDATVKASTTYVYSIRAYDPNGNLSEPGTLSVTTPAAPLPGSLDIIVNGQIRT
ncbi:MAG: fibronectin type III domain-containing protein [Steroidobacteraceae bacterium]|nr:fibronectin type III domain-containing protein [Deltaproteobacteria bacterium]